MPSGISQHSNRKRKRSIGCDWLSCAHPGSEWPMPAVIVDVAMRWLTRTVGSNAVPLMGKWLALMGALRSVISPYTEFNSQFGRNAKPDVSSLRKGSPQHTSLAYFNIRNKIDRSIGNGWSGSKAALALKSLSLQFVAVQSIGSEIGAECVEDECIR